MGKVVVGLDQVQQQIQIEIGYNVLNVGRYDHFAKDCPNISDIEKEQSGQIQQMLNLEEDKTAIKVLAADTYDALIRTGSEEAIDHLN